MKPSVDPNNEMVKFYISAFESEYPRSILSWTSF